MPRWSSLRWQHWASKRNSFAHIVSSDLSSNSLPYILLKIHVKYSMMECIDPRNVTDAPGSCISNGVITLPSLFKRLDFGLRCIKKASPTELNLRCLGRVVANLDCCACVYRINPLQEITVIENGFLWYWLQNRSFCLRPTAKKSGYRLTAALLGQRVR